MDVTLHEASDESEKEDGSIIDELKVRRKVQDMFEQRGSYINNEEQSQDLKEYSFKLCDIDKILSEANGQLTNLMKHGYLFMKSIEDEDEFVNHMKLDWHRMMMWRSQDIKHHSEHWAFINRIIPDLIFPAFDHFEESRGHMISTSGTCIFWAYGLKEPNMYRLIKKVIATLRNFLEATRLNQKALEYLAKILTHLLRVAVDGFSKPKTKYINELGCTRHVHQIQVEIKFEYKKLIKFVNKSKKIQLKIDKLLAVKEGKCTNAYVRRAVSELLQRLVAKYPRNEIYQLWDFACILLGAMPIASRCTPMILVAEWLCFREKNSLSEFEADTIVAVSRYYLDRSHILDPFYAIQILQILVFRHPKNINDKLASSIVSTTLLAKDALMIPRCPSYVHKFSRHNLTYIFIAFYAVDKCQLLHKLIDETRKEFDLKSHIREWCDRRVGNQSLGYLDEIIFPLDSEPMFEPWHHNYISLIALSKVLSLHTPSTPICLPLVMRLITGNLPTNLLLQYKHSMEIKAPLPHRDFYRTAKIYEDHFLEHNPKQDYYEVESLHYYRNVKDAKFLDKPFLLFDKAEKKLQKKDGSARLLWEMSKQFWFNKTITKP